MELWKVGVIAGVIIFIFLGTASIFEFRAVKTQIEDEIIGKYIPPVFWNEPGELRPLKKELKAFAERKDLTLDLEEGIQTSFNPMPQPGDRELFEQRMYGGPFSRTVTIRVTFKQKFMGIPISRTVEGTRTNSVRVPMDSPF